MQARTKCRTIGDSSRPLIMNMKEKDCTMLGLKQFVNLSSHWRWDMCVLVKRAVFLFLPPSTPL